VGGLVECCGFLLFFGVEVSLGVSGLFRLFLVVSVGAWLGLCVVVVGGLVWGVGFEVLRALFVTCLCVGWLAFESGA